MDLSTFVVAVFCLVDDWLKDQGRLRERGPAPKLSDSEVLTIEVVGEFLGIDTDSGLFTHFRRHHAELFPALREVHRTTFCRQAANLWRTKEQLWRLLSSPASEHPRLLAMIDSFPIPPYPRAGGGAPTAAGSLPGCAPTATTKAAAASSTGSGLTS